ncbi:MAG: Na/Pi cotransporter family protein [Clostridiales bacterium]|nr:Na/Pi cotransporter family protein [Clostridiales bacterium]
MDIFAVFSLFGGLALFLYGMTTMGSGLEKLAGGRLERIFEKLTSNKIKAVLLGAGVTGIIQSSSATTVLLVGFVNSGIMKLGQAIGVIMGANIGTTVTAWILSLSGISGEGFFLKLLKPTSFSPIIAVIGVILIMFAKSQKKKDIGSILIGFAVLMMGMDVMSSSVVPLANSETFKGILLMFSRNPILGVLAGAGLTAIIQSSSASVGILQAMSVTGALTFSSAMPIILGQNIGTCVTALLSSIGTTKGAKRVAFVHLYFNIIGTVLFLGGYYTINAIIGGFSFSSSALNEVGIATIHTIFNVTTTLVLLPFTHLLEKLAYMTIKDSKDDMSRDEEFKLLDERFLNSPAFAIEQCRTVASKMAILSKDTILKSVKIIKKYSAEIDLEVQMNEKVVDMYEDKIGKYLVKLSGKNPSENDSQNISILLHSIGDFERISDHAVNIAKVAKEISDKRIDFSEKARKELDVILGAVTEVLEITIKAFNDNDTELARTVEPLEEVIDQLRTRLKNRHVKRLQEGKCTIELGFVFTDLLTNLERVSDHCSNIAVSIIQMHDTDFETHEYIHELRTGGTNFEEMVSQYQEKYTLPTSVSV